MSETILVMTISALCFPPETLIETYEGKKMIKDLVRGELILTKSGYKHLTKVAITQNEDNKFEYIKIPKNTFGSLPVEDLFLSRHHPFSLGFKDFKADNKTRKLINPGVSYWLIADQLKNRFPGVELVVLDKSYHNLIFDDEEEFSVYGMKVLSHHPRGHPLGIKEEDYFSKINPHERKIKMVEWDEFLKEKNEDETVENFVERKLKFEEDFDWKQYVKNYSDLSDDMTQEEARKHWEEIGKKEDRTFYSRGDLYL